jgi:crotonobetainyl-CoA:carnitine CoA-transferase CaiB-like acyl-CoA transferase
MNDLENEAQMTSKPAALGHIRVLDFTRVLAGPFCTMNLADLGADVIKVENPDGGDDSRRFLPPELNGNSTYFMHVNRGKRSIVVALRPEDGRAAVRSLALTCDVVVENFRSDVMARLGLDYESLRDEHPGLVYCSINGYGSEGDYATRPGLDPVIQAECGLMAVTGAPDGPPMRIGVSLVDAVTGLYAAQMVTTALLHRERTGEGQRVEVCLFDTGVNMLVNFAAAYLMAGDVPERAGNGNLVSQPAGVYEASDGPFLLTVVGDAPYVRLCREVLKEPALAEDPRFRTNPDRLGNASALNAELAVHFGSATRGEWIARLRDAQIPCGEIRSLDEALTSPEFVSRALTTQIEHPSAGTVTALRSPMRMSGSPCRTPTRAPLYGEHTESVLREMLGLDDRAIEALRGAGAIAGSAVT